MVSLGFPFSSFPPPINNLSSRHLLTASIAAATCAGIAITHNSTKHKHKHKHPILQNTLQFILTHLPSTPNSHSPLWGCLSLSSDFTVTDSKTGTCFPSVVKDSQNLLGIGVRRKSILGLKNIDVYAFGIYADEDEVEKNLKEKYGSNLKENIDFSADLLESDVNMTVRLQIVYSRLNIKSVRSAFEESVGSRMQKFGGPGNNELLQRFTSQFKDELKIPKGSVIELSRDRGYVLRTKIDGAEVGSIESKLLCQSVLDLYIGEAPFDLQAKEHVMHKLANAFVEKNSAAA